MLKSLEQAVISRFNDEFDTIGGHIDTDQIIDYPADASTRTWLKGKLSTTDGEAKFHFMDAI